MTTRDQEVEKLSEALKKLRLNQEKLEREQAMINEDIKTNRRVIGSMTYSPT